MMKAEKKQMETLITDKPTNRDELIRYLLETSKAHPGYIIDAYTVFQETIIRFHDCTLSRMRWDSGDLMLNLFGGFLKAGIVIKPSQKWLARKEYKLNQMAFSGDK